MFHYPIFSIITLVGLVVTVYSWSMWSRSWKRYEIFCWWFWFYVKTLTFRLFRIKSVFLGIRTHWSKLSCMFFNPPFIIHTTPDTNKIVIVCKLYGMPSFISALFLSLDLFDKAQGIFFRICRNRFNCSDCKAPTMVLYLSSRLYDGVNK